MFRRIFLFLFLLIGVIVGFSGEVFVKQCVYNDFGVVFKVYWYNVSGYYDYNVMNESFLVGFQVCQNNDNLGFVEIKCFGCIFVEVVVKILIVVVGIFVFGVCFLVMEGGCGFVGEIFVDVVVEVV